MSLSPEDAAREHRFSYEVFVDAYTEEEQALCWYYYLEGKLNFPFRAYWGKQVFDVVGMSGEEDVDADVELGVCYRDGDPDDIFPVLAAELDPIESDAQTVEALADLQYWIQVHGYG